ncbi:hypothetical protein [Streptomyces sp. NBC_01538]|uniref:hypothetical protein n=1 Tax=Streptomyces sp. NBC_01538 TaxID=2903897 RepID=UPI00386DFE50
MSPHNREPHATAPPTPPPHDHELTQALRAIEDIGRWAVAIDTKSTLVAAMASTVVVGLLSQADLIHYTWDRSVLGAPLPASLLAASLAALAAALTELAAAIFPRLDAFTQSRFSYPWLAVNDLDTAATPPHAPSRDAWQHARLLARLNVRKLRHLRWAICMTTAAAVLFIAWFIALACSTTT